jgi:2-haloacid dehalogenase
MGSERWASFDCYGTLIDWMSGIRSTLGSLWPGADVDPLVGRYQLIEPTVQAGRGIAYRAVMEETLAGVAAAAGLEVPDGSADALGESLPSWPVFPEVPGALRELQAREWRLAILSNTDPDLLEASLAAIRVPVDVRIVASEVGSYKPAFGHWETFFRATGADRQRHVHVAASLFHDIEPCAMLGLSAVWINRSNEMSELPRAGELPDLSPLPDTIDELIPADHT